MAEDQPDEGSPEGAGERRRSGVVRAGPMGYSGRGAPRSAEGRAREDAADAARQSAMTPLYREHPTMFADEPGKFIFACLLVIVPLVVAAIYWSTTWIAYSMLALAAFGAVTFLWWFITNRSIVVTVDEERITLRRGVLSKENIEVEISSIRTVRVDQTFVDRIFDCGILKVYTAGDRPDLVQDGLPDPARLRTALRSARAL
jgi:uncharacterized membrane protein YdbT with pleckstrin-like domain